METKFQDMKTKLEELRDSGRCMTLNEFYALSLLGKVENLQRGLEKILSIIDEGDLSDSVVWLNIENELIEITRNINN